MKRIVIILLAVTGWLAGAAVYAQNVNVRGVVTAFDGKMISVKSREGRDVRIELPDNAPVNITRPLQLSDLKLGQVVGVTTIKRADGATVAIDVRPIPPTANQGLSPYDLQPGSVMTNAALEGTVQATGGHELTLNYKSGTAKVLVPEGTPMSQAAPGERSDIKVGETIYAVARTEPDGRLVAVRVQMSKDGVKPMQ